MEASERDSTNDWVLGPDERPPSVQELVERIDQAVAAARASEGAVEVVGEAAIRAAERARQAVEQANRAAEQAERSAVTAERAGAMLANGRGIGAATVGAPGTPPARKGGDLYDDERMRSFVLRADRVAARLRAL